MKLTPAKKLRLIEFLVIGIVMGTAEDLLAVAFATDAQIDARVFLVVLLVALPFAFVSEVVVDHPRFWKKVLPFIREEEEKIEQKITG
ncbi:MAG: hypothetical protein AMXMBFR44_0510 [Candidatus Campbellbacteria bacterium]